VASRFTYPPAFHAFIVAEQPGAVLTRVGLSVTPLHRLADIHFHFSTAFDGEG
jgi:hypothetical protein